MKIQKKTEARIALLVCIMVIVTLTGCGGEKKEAASSQTESGSRSEQSADPEDDAAETDGNPANENDVGENTDNEDSATELDGDVRSVSESSVVVSKIFSETTESDEGTVWILSSLGGGNEVLVTVYFETNADYVYKTIRNGGRDVDTREGSFSDIKEGMILLLNGRYVGEDFYADHVEIDNVVLGDAW